MIIASICIPETRAHWGLDGARQNVHFANPIESTARHLDNTVQSRYLIDFLDAVRLVEGFGFQTAHIEETMSSSVDCFCPVC